MLCENKNSRTRMEELVDAIDESLKMLNRYDDSDTYGKEIELGDR